jgi:solute carrier family 25 carnitine/acylcarnitine transporter 20/29
MISGGVGGFCVVLVGYPFDFLKTRLQTSPTHTPLLSTIRQVWRSTGWRGFYQGVTAPLIGVSPIFAVNFYGYELGKRLYGKLWNGSDDVDYSFNGGLPISQYAFGAAFSALQTALIVIPAERIKVFMQMPRTPDSYLAKLNAIQVGIRIYKEGGLRALFRGSTATLMRDVPGLMTFFAAYEIFKQKLRPSDADEASFRYMASVMTAGGLAGMASWMISLPPDVIKSQVQAAAKNSALSKERFPTWVVFRELMRKEGPTALYRGLTPVLLRAFPANAACFLGYEITKISLQRVL